jgi:hypothetical protein
MEAYEWGEAFGGIVLVGAVIWAFVWQAQSNRRRRAIYAQEWVERRAAELVRELPDYDDAAITQTIRDELVTRHVEDPDAYRWAHPETVGRVRRALSLAARRQA